MRWPLEKRFRELGLERVGIRHAPPAERGSAPEPRLRPGVPVRRDQAPRPCDAEHGERHLGGAGRRADAGRRGEDEPANRVGAQRRGAEPDDAAERVADPDGAVRALRVRDPENGLGQRIDVARFGQRIGVSVARQIGDEDAVTRRERRRERAPVLDRAAETVDEDEGRS